MSILGSEIVIVTPHARLYKKKWGRTFDAASVATTGALNYAGAVTAAVAANLAATASPSAVGTAVAADLGAAAAFNNLVAASTSAAIIAATP